jgi:cytochrome c oxidase cbb3-type subunit 1
LLAAAFLAPVVFVIGNLPFSSGVPDVIVSGFYQNGLVMLWFLPAGFAVAYYVVPIETGNSLYSYALARAGFWSLMFAGGWTGQRLFLKGPTPSYLQSIAVAMTFVLVIPVVSSVANLYATARGRWHLLGQTFGLRFAMVGLGMAATWIVLLAVFGMPFVSRYFGLTAVDAALRHLAAWGVFSAFAFALIYHAYPLMVGRDWYSRPLATLHFWASIAGVVIATLGLLSAGDAQAGALVATSASGLSASVHSTLGLQHLYEVTTLAGTAIFAAAQLAFAFNAIRTSRAGPIVPVYAAVSVGTTA